MEGFRDGSGLFAVAGHREAAHLTYLGLHALQHRGAGGCGLAVSDGHLLRHRSGVGLVQEAMGGGHLQGLTGVTAIGQVWGRDEPSARQDLDGLDAQRMVFARYHGGQAAGAVSGRFTNGTRLRRELKQAGAVLHTPSDAEVLLHMLARSSQRTFVNRLVDALWKIEGAYSLVVCADHRLVALRDPSGFRPLVLGRLGDAVLLSSEDTAIRFVGGEVRREVRPGELVVLDGLGVQSVEPFQKRASAACIHEFVSLARSDAEVFGQRVHAVRRALGTRLAREHPCPDAGVVVGLPDAGGAAAAGYAQEAQLPNEQGLERAPYTGRHYEEPATGLRDFGMKLTWRPVPSVVQGKVVCLVAPSLVTGRALRKAVRLIRDVGAVGIHVRVASPLVRSACYYGVSSPTVDELAHTNKPDAQELARWLDVRSVAALSAEGLLDVVATGSDLPVCDACFSGTHPLPPEEPDDQLPLF